MTVLIGIDVQPIDEVEYSIATFGPRYTSRLYTENELDTCGTDLPSTASRLAARFAAKEAMLKILEAPDISAPWRSIEVELSANGRPEIVLSGDVALIAKCQGIVHISVSLSHAGGIATAAVIAETAAPGAVGK